MALIVYNPQSPFGSQMSLAIQGLKRAQANIQSIKQTADTMTNGGVTPANLEGSAQFGVAAGQGAVFYAAIQSIMAALYTTPSTWTPVQATIDLDTGVRI